MAAEKRERYEESEIYRIRHSAAHVMAQAVMEMFPGEAKIAIGPPIEDGFYYDFDLPRPLTPEDLEVIENRMREIIAGDYRYERDVLSADRARELFADQPYKIELIEGLESGGTDEYGEPIEGPVEISIFTHDTFTDLCRGPHVEDTSKINPDAVKLLNVAGAYWRGDERRPMLQRIYGTAWKTAEELEQYLWRLDEARRRDHRRLGKELDLYSISDAVGPGLILWHPKGGMVRKIAEDYCRAQHLEAGYEFVYSPHIGKANLWEKSGHLDWYQEGMFAPLDIEGQQYYIKPMNCPFHVEIYKSRTMPEEIDMALQFSLSILRAFGFEDFYAYLSTRNPEKFAGEPEEWDAPTEALRASLERAKLPYQIDEGQAVFYGPKIDLKLKDALNREWQLSTIQFDFILPERLDLTYVGEDGKEHRPYMIHRALVGSMERFMGALIEHHAGAFPVWLSPVQAILIPIADRHVDYANSVGDQLKKAGLRIDVDERSERMNAKIRDAQLQKVPYMLIIGDQEVETGAVAVRLRSGEDLGAMPIEDFLRHAEEDIQAKR